MTRPGWFHRQMALAMAVILAVVMAAIAATVGLAYRSFAASTDPQVLAKAATAGRSLADTLSLAARHALPLDSLVGVEDLFGESQASFPEFARIELSKDGRTLRGKGPEIDGALVARVPVAGYEADRAEVAVTVDPRFVERIFREMAMDLVVVAVVALFVSLELLYFLAAGLLADLGRLRAQLAAFGRGAFVALPKPAWLGVALGEALEARRAALEKAHDAAPEAVRRVLPAGTEFVDTRGARGTNDAAFVMGAMRTPFFLLLLADDLSRAFLPLFAASLPAGGLSLSPNLVASLPVVSFMVVVALSQPLLGGWSERVGRRRSFLAGAGVALAAHALSAQSSSLPELLAWRMAGGAAWAIAFVAAQGYILDHTDSRTRTAGLAAFVGIIMVSLICGPPIGGLLADGLGQRGTLAIGAALAGLGLVLAWRRLPADETREAPAAAAVAKGSLATVLANRRFVALLAFAAVPAKLILIAYCYYLIPLYIVEQGSTPAMAGRLIMLYSVMMVVLVPWMAGWVVARRAREAARPEPAFVVVGLALSGLAGLAMLLPFGIVSVLALVLLLGLGQAISISPQAAMVAEVCRDEIATVGQGAVYGVYRLVERMGNASGPLVAALLLEAFGFRDAFVGIGLALLACAVFFGLVFLPRRARAVRGTP